MLVSATNAPAMTTCTTVPLLVASTQSDRLVGEALPDRVIVVHDSPALERIAGGDSD